MKRITILMIVILAYSCIKHPDYPSSMTAVRYEFEGGKDMGALFDFTATYTDKDHKRVEERIASLPWSRQVVVDAPFEAHLEIGFQAKTEFPDQATYEVGFKGKITQSEQTKSVRSPAQNVSEGKSCKLRFSIELPVGISADNIGITIPPLKYNKHFAFSYTIDDSPVEAYSRIWSRIHKKWIDDNNKFHINTPPSTGYIPSNTLGMTDGCGNERRFGFGMAIWATDGNDYSPDGFITGDNQNSNYISWIDLKEMVDFGVSVYYHNVNRRIYDENSLTSIIQGYEADRQKVMAQLGFSMKTMALPDGNAAYIEAAEEYDQIAFIRTSLNRPGEYTKPKIYLNAVGSLYKNQTYDGISGDPNLPLSELKSQNASDNPYWVCHTTHTPSLEIMEMFSYINDVYGKDGADNLWVASFDEVYEYHTMREEADINRDVQGRTATFEVTLPWHPNFYFPELSFLVSGTGGDCEVVPLSDNIFGLSHAAHGDGMLININFNPELLKRAEKFTTRYEASGLETDKDDAQYFVSMLLPELAAPFNARLEHTVPPVILKGISINDGVSTTYVRDVRIGLEVEGTPSSYRIGETADLSDLPWKEYAGSSMRYTLSKGYGQKTIYIQIGDGSQISNTVSAAIEYAELPESGVIDRAAVDAYLKKYNGHVLKVDEKVLGK